jgi:hypothetical protein
MATAGDVIARSEELGIQLSEGETEDFFLGLIDLCKDCGTELGKREFEDDALILSMEYRMWKKKERDAVLPEDQLIQSQSKVARRGLMLIRDVENAYSRRGAR